MNAPRSGAGHDRPRVLVVGEINYHYRQDVFAALQADDDFEFEFVADVSTRDGSIRPSPPGTFVVEHRVRNHYLGSCLWQSGLLGLIRRRRPDAVIFLGDPHYLSTWVAAAYARLCRRHVLFWTIGWSRPDAGAAGRIRLVYFRLAEILLLYGNTGRRLGIAAGYPAARMAVIYNSSAVTSDARQTLDGGLDDRLPPPGREIVTAVLRLNRAKRLDMLIDAVALINSEGRGVGVMLVGEGPEGESLRTQAERLSVPLYMPGAVYDEASLARIYARSTVTVIPSFAGLTTLQSFRHGIPVISHDDDYQQVPEAEAIEEGVTGSRYRVGDVDSLAHTIGQWLDKQAVDRAKTAAACQDVVTSRWSAPAQAARITGALRDLLPSRERVEVDTDGVHPTPMSPP